MNINIECKNEYNGWEIDLEKVKDIAQSILEFFFTQPEITNKCILKNYQYHTISFDFLFCGSGNTHAINLEYRSKDYPADIITFAVFADSEQNERFVLDGEINLGEIIIALDKMIDGAKEKNISKEDELSFFISHGIMHLLGFDHQTQEEYNFVIEQQKKALESINIIYDKI
jgi:probable rRNA maturation factor